MAIPVRNMGSTEQYQREYQLAWTATARQIFAVGIFLAVLSCTSGSSSVRGAGGGLGQGGTSAARTGSASGAGGSGAGSSAGSGSPAVRISKDIRPTISGTAA